MITTVTGKNQITIPARLARELDIQPGMRLDWSLDKDGVLIVHVLPKRSVLARKIAGMAKEWLENDADPISDLIIERTQDDIDEGLY